MSRALAFVENALIALFAAALVVIAGGQIVARIGFDAGWSELDDAMRSMVLWIALLGAMVAAREDRHLAIDALSRFLGGTSARVSRFLAYGGAAVVSGLIAWHAFALVRGEYEAPTMAFAKVPSWFVQAIIPIAFTVMAVRFFLHALKAPPPHVPGAPAPDELPPIHVAADAEPQDHRTSFPSRRAGERVAPQDPTTP